MDLKKKKKTALHLGFPLSPAITPESAKLQTPTGSKTQCIFSFASRLLTGAMHELLLLLLLAAIIRAGEQRGHGQCTL